MGGGKGKVDVILLVETFPSHHPTHPGGFAPSKKEKRNKEVLLWKRLRFQKL